MSVVLGIVVSRHQKEEVNVCWLCDHPGATEYEYIDHLRQLIDAHGWVVQGVERDGMRPPWAYTVGLTGHGRPELVVTGIGLTKGTKVLNGVAAHLMHAHAPEPGTQAALLDGPLVEVVEVAVPWAHLKTAVEVYGQRVRGLQLVHADDRGHWPWDRWYRGVRGGQPILGLREPPERGRRVG
jgi:Domain of unknown function (DUF4262)